MLFNLLLLAISASAGAQCPPSPGMASQEIRGDVAYEQIFNEEFGPGLRFVLLPERAGWTIAVQGKDGEDLSRLTPPLRGPNPRDLAGWHLRNRDNTGPNEGSVNAPQLRRGFIYSPRVGTTLGLPDGPIQPPDVVAVADDGHGELEILDYGLADLEAGQQARLVWLRFRVCLRWKDALDWPVPDPIPLAVADLFRLCGLPAGLELSDHLKPAFLEGDFDGDGELDTVAAVRRPADGKRAVALCHSAAQRTFVVGLDETLGELSPAYFDRMDWWSVDRSRKAQQGAIDEAPPRLRGDALTLGIEGASSVLLYWAGARYQSYWQGD